MWIYMWIFISIDKSLYMWEALVLPIHSLYTYISHIDVCTVCIHLCTLFTFETYISYRVFWTPPTCSKFIQERHWMNQRILDFLSNEWSVVGWQIVSRVFTISKLIPGSFQKLFFCSFPNSFYVVFFSCVVQQCTMGKLQWGDGIRNFSLFREIMTI